MRSKTLFTKFFCSCMFRLVPQFPQWFPSCQTKYVDTKTTWIITDPLAKWNYVVGNCSCRIWSAPGTRSTFAMRKNKLNNTMYEIKSTEIPLWFLHHMRQPVPAQQFHSFPLALCLCATIQHQKNHAIQIRVIPVLPGDLVCTEFNSHFKQSTAHLFRLRAVCSKGNRNATKSPRYTSTAQSHILIVFFWGWPTLGCTLVCTTINRDSRIGNTMPSVHASPCQRPVAGVFIQIDCAANPLNFIL